jgi:hypothetical protein
VKGIEPSSLAWKAIALPLSYTRGGADARRATVVSHPRSDWGVQDSNLRRQCHQIYSLTPLTARETPLWVWSSRNVVSHPKTLISLPLAVASHFRRPRHSPSNRHHRLITTKPPSELEVLRGAIRAGSPAERSPNAGDNAIRAMTGERLSPSPGLVDLRRPCGRLHPRRSVTSGTLRRHSHDPSTRTERTANLLRMSPPAELAAGIEPATC